MNNYIEYIKAGIGLDPSFYKKSCCAMFILALLSAFPGFVLGGFWLGLFVIMSLLALTATGYVWIISSKKLTVKNRLLIQTVIFSTVILQFIIIEIIVASNLFGIRPILFLFLLQPFLLPAIMAYLNDRALKSGESRSKNGGLVIGGSVFGFAGVIGMTIGRIFFADISQLTALIIIVICSSFIISMLSIGLLSIHRLYYLYQYEKKYGSFPD